MGSAPPPESQSPRSPSQAARPERLLIVTRDADDSEGAARYFFARWADWPHPAMLSLAAGGEQSGEAGRLRALEGALNPLLGARMGVVTASVPRVAAERTPVRMAHPRFGGEGMGWLRAAAVTVRPLAGDEASDGEPRPDALLEAVERLSFEEALEALPTDVERRLFSAGAALLD